MALKIVDDEGCMTLVVVKQVKAHVIQKATRLSAPNGSSGYW